MADAQIGCTGKEIIIIMTLSNDNIPIVVITLTKCSGALAELRSGVLLVAAITLIINNSSTTDT